MVVAARAKTTLPMGLKDSKVLSKKKREELLSSLLEPCDFGEGWVQPAEIDSLGLTNAMQLAVSRALAGLKADYNDEIIMDGTINYCDQQFTNVSCIARADVTHPIVSAASIYAKVIRDNKMAELSLVFPGYGFESHVGYGTKVHADALKLLGVNKLHRLSYKPVRAYIS